MPIELYSQEQDRLAKAGQPDVYQYDTIPIAFRQQVIFIWSRSLGEYGSYQSGTQAVPRRANTVWAKIYADFIEAFGVAALNNAPNVALQCHRFLLAGETKNVLNLIRVTFREIEASTHIMRSYITPQICTQAISDLNFRFRQHSLGYEYVNGQILKKSSEFLHAQAVRPALSLLTAPGFAGPMEEFLSAHSHFLKSEFKDAILDANNAFESTMKAICGLRGWPYDKTDTAKVLIGIMFDNDLVPRFLMNQFDHLRLVLESGLPTARNKTGGHGQGEVPVVIPEHPAAYAIHLSAANIVLLVEAHKARPT